MFIFIDFFKFKRRLTSFVSVAAAAAANISITITFVFILNFVLCTFNDF